MFLSVVEGKGSDFFPSSMAWYKQVVESNPPDKSTTALSFVGSELFRLEFLFSLEFKNNLLQIDPFSFGPS